MSSFKLKTDLLNANGGKQQQRRPQPEKQVTLDKVLTWIQDKLQIEEEIKKELIKEVKSYPQGSLLHYTKNIRHHVQVIRDQVYGARARRGEVVDPVKLNLPPLPTEWDQ